MGVMGVVFRNGEGVMGTENRRLGFLSLLSRHISTWTCW